MPIIQTWEPVKALIQEVISDGQISWSEAWRVFGAITGAAVETLAVLKDPDQFDALVAECEAAYDELLAPIDIKFLPNWIENRFVDPLIRSQIRPILRAALDGLDLAQ